MAPHNCQASPCSQASSSPGNAARHPLPCPTQAPTASQDRASRNAQKTVKEKAKGLNIIYDDFIGVKATTPCARCAAARKSCYVARNPAAYQTYKCGNCISKKVCCNFNINNPGVPYDEGSTEANRKRESRKAQGRRMAAATRRRRAAEGKAKAKAEAEPKAKEGSA
ncbi:hypothetical protein F5Y07DRAFT_403914 [Xylaria sp. FL0933]|nr:hypothetical protein F5Y07DRAFT_403914 [Xylaria sp. FL0933]